MHTLTGKGLPTDGLPGSNNVLRGDLAGRPEFCGWHAY